MISLSSCDCTFNYQFVIFYTMDQEVVVELRKQNGDPYRKVLPPNGSDVLYQGDAFRWGCTNCVGHSINSADGTINYFLSDLRVHLNDSTEALTDFNKEAHWDFTSHKKLGVYRAGVKASDF
jgi:hypothetical protein